MMRAMMIVLVLLLVSGCAAVDVFDMPSSNHQITTDTLEGVIFTADNTEKAGIGYEFNDPIMGYWTPTEIQVMALESSLVPYLKETIGSDGYGAGLWDKLSGYRRQYFGVTFANGQPLIYANYFCTSDYFDNWLDSHVIVMDGGECFFHVLYDPAKDTFSNLSINSMA